MFVVMPKIPLLGSKIWWSITLKSGICPFFLKEAVNMGWGASRFIKKKKKKNIYIYIYIYIYMLKQVKFKNFRKWQLYLRSWNTRHGHGKSHGIWRTWKNSNPALAVFVHGSPEFKSSTTLVNSQLVCLRPGGILNPVETLVKDSDTREISSLSMFDLNYLFKSFAGFHQHK